MRVSAATAAEYCKNSCSNDPWHIVRPGLRGGIVLVPTKGKAGQRQYKLECQCEPERKSKYQSRVRFEFQLQRQRQLPVKLQHKFEPKNAVPFTHAKAKPERDAVAFPDISRIADTEPESPTNGQYQADVA